MLDVVFIIIYMAIMYYFKAVSEAAIFYKNSPWFSGFGIPVNISGSHVIKIDVYHLHKLWFELSAIGLGVIMVLSGYWYVVLILYIPMRLLVFDRMLEYIKYYKNEKFDWERKVEKYLKENPVESGTLELLDTYLRQTEAKNKGEKNDN